MNKILFLLLIIFCCACAGNITTYNIKYKQIPINYNNIGIIHRKLYVSNIFNKHEKSIILEATKEWNRTTGERVVIDLMDMSVDTVFNKDSIIIYPSTYNNSVVKISEDKAAAKKVYGLCWSKTIDFPVIWIIYDRIESDKIYYLTVIHELGHALGLEHSEYPYDLMYSYLNENIKGLTEGDLEQFCKKYNCN